MRVQSLNLRLQKAHREIYLSNVYHQDFLVPSTKGRVVYSMKSRRKSRKYRKISKQKAKPKVDGDGRSQTTLVSVSTATSLLTLRNPNGSSEIARVFHAPTTDHVSSMIQIWKAVSQFCCLWRTLFGKTPQRMIWAARFARTLCRLFLPTQWST